MSLHTGGKVESQRGNFMFNFVLTDILRATFFGVLVAISNRLFHIPLMMPGHTSIWWICILLVGKGLVPKFGSGIIMGVVSGILAVIFGLGKEGIFVFFKFFIVGLSVDILAPFFFYKLESMVVGMLCGALASLIKLIVSMALGLLLHIPLLFLTVGLGFVAISHALYGAIGGALATIIIKRLKTRLLHLN